MSAANASNQPFHRAAGRALIVGSADCRAMPMSTLQRLGFSCAEVDDPYAALIELAKRPMVYRALVLSLGSVYREELPLIATIKRSFRHVDVWLTQADGRLNALAEAMRLGADGLLTDDGLHRTASTDASPIAPTSSAPASPFSRGTGKTGVDEPHPDDFDLDPSPGEPVLTADELRALLKEQPTSTPQTSGETP